MSAKNKLYAMSLDWCVWVKVYTLAYQCAAHRSGLGWMGLVLPQAATSLGRISSNTSWVHLERDGDQEEKWSSHFKCRDICDGPDFHASTAVFHRLIFTTKVVMNYCPQIEMF